MNTTTPDQMRAKLTTPVGIVSLLLLIIATLAAWYIDHSQRSVSELLKKNIAAVRNAQEIEISIRETRTHLSRFLITGESKYLGAIPDLKQRTENAFTAAEATIDSVTEHQLFQQFRQGYSHFLQELDKLMNQAATQGIIQKLIDLQDTIFVNEIESPARDYLQWNENTLNQTMKVHLRETDWLSLALLCLGLSGAGGGLLGGWVMTSAIRRNILHTEEQLRSTAVKLQEAIPIPPSKEVQRGSRNPIEDVTRSASAVLSRLKRTEQEALRAEQLAWVGQMAAGIAHEVRNPLMAIKLLVQTIAETRGAEGFQPKQIRVLEEEIVRLEQIISTFLDYARPPRLEKKLIEIGPLVQQVIDSVQARANLQNVAIELMMPAGQVMAEIDGNQLRQVIYNLVYNALDAQPRGGKIVIRMLVDSQNVGDLSQKIGDRRQIKHESPSSVSSLQSPISFLLEVEDKGPGLPLQLGDRIFEPFVSTKPSGLGLGLSICRRIVERHGGVLRANNTKSGGALFSIHLPYSPAPEGAGNKGTAVRDQGADIPHPSPLALPLSANPR